MSTADYPDGTVFIPHLDPQYKHARHYTGNPENSAFPKAGPPRRASSAPTGTGRPSGCR
jgi:hypothetical protein